MSAAISVELSPEQIRAHLDELLCPFCKRGPFKVPLAHIAQAHDVSGAEVREMAQIPMGAPVTESGYHDTVATRMRETRSGESIRKMVAKSVEYRAQHGRRRTAALRESASKGLASARSGYAQKVLSRDTTLIARWRRSGEKWEELADIAQELGVSEKSARARLRALGFDIGDGRALTARRPEPRPKRHDCDVDRCPREHVARGLCRYHYQAWRIANGRVPECESEGCDQPIVARRLCSTHYAAARARSKR